MARKQRGQTHFTSTTKGCNIVQSTTMKSQDTIADVWKRNPLQLQTVKKNSKPEFATPSMNVYSHVPSLPLAWSGACPRCSICSYLQWSRALSFACFRTCLTDVIKHPRKRNISTLPVPFRNNSIVHIYEGISCAVDPARVKVIQISCG